MNTQNDFSRRPSTFQKLKINRKFSVIILCLFVSVIFWFLIALSKTYPARLRFPLKYTNIPEFKVVTNDLPRAIDVSVKTTGFKILSYQFGSKNDSVEFDVASKIQSGTEKGKDVIMIPSKVFANDLTEQLGTEFLITGFYPDSIPFNLSYKLKVMLPVQLDAKITFEKQFDTTDHVILFPDCVAVSGPASVLRGIQRIETEPVVFENLKTSVNTKVKLKKGKLTSLDMDEVTVKIPVEKFTEGFTEVPVHVINVAKGYSLKTYPDKILVHYRVALSQYNKIGAEMFDVVADASGLPGKDISQIKVSLGTFPEFIRLPSLQPDKVSFILQKQ